MRNRLMAVAVILAFTVAAAGEAFARMGGGRSSGSRGSRGMSAPYRPSAPAGTTSPYPQGAAPAPAPSQSGGLFRSLAAGMAGGYLGSLLAGGMSGCGSRADRQAADNAAVDPSGREEAGGGLSFLDLLLLAGLAYLAYRFFVKRRLQQQQQQQQDIPAFPPATGDAGASDRLQGIGRIRQTDPSFDEKTFCEQATDLFFRLQGAWTRRDLAPVADLLTEEMRGALQADVDGMRAKRQVNRLENIAVRSVEITEVWQESGREYVTARFTASLLDYTTDEAGKVLSGSDAAPVKFEEFWTLTRPVGPGPWKLSAIQQP